MKNLHDVTGFFLAKKQTVLTLTVDAQRCPLVALQILGNHGAEYII